MPRDLRNLAGMMSFAAMLLAGCTKEHPHSDLSVEPMLRRASGACLATIARLEEHDDRPADGDHRIEAWLQIEESSGTIPEFLRLVIDPGGQIPDDDLANLRADQSTRVLRPTSLRVGERHWFVFSTDYDATKYPRNVAGWWRYGTGDVPHDVIMAIQTDRFARHPVFDATLNVVSEWEQAGERVQIRVRDADSLAVNAVLFQTSLTGKLTSLSIAHWPITYEFEWPRETELHLLHVELRGHLAADNEFGLPADRYRMRLAFDLASGRKCAQWVAKDQQARLMRAYRQYDLDTGLPIIEMKFDLLETGGLAIGSDTEHWYRRTVRRFSNGQLQSTAVFRHAVITTGTERADNSSGWIPVETDVSK